MQFREFMQEIRRHPRPILLANLFVIGIFFCHWLPSRHYLHNELTFNPFQGQSSARLEYPNAAPGTSGEKIATILRIPIYDFIEWTFMPYVSRILNSLVLALLVYTLFCVALSRRKPAPFSTFGRSTWLTVVILGAVFMGVVVYSQNYWTLL